MSSKDLGEQSNRGWIIGGIAVAGLVGLTSWWVMSSRKKDKLERVVEVEDATAVLMVSDLNQSIEFYTECLGFEVQRRSKGKVYSSGECDESDVEEGEETNREDKAAPGEWAVLWRDCHGVMLRQLAHGKSPRPNSESENGCCDVVFFVGHVKRLFSQLSKTEKVDVVEKLNMTNANPAMFQFTIRDVNGYRLQFWGTNVEKSIEDIDMDEDPD